MKNKLAYLGFLGLIGLGGIFPGNAALFSFLSFFTFFSYANVIPDELFWENVKTSALRAFVAQIVISTVTIAAGSLFSANARLFTGIMTGGMSLNYGTGIVIFALSLVWCGHREKKGKSA